MKKINIKEKIGQFQSFMNKNKDLFVLAAFILVVGLIMLISKKSDNKIEKDVVKIEFEAVFDYSKVPSGIIIWKHGVPESRKEFVYVDSTARYEYFDIGIFNVNDKKVYCVRVPYYAIGMFKLGVIINFENKPKKRNPLYRKNVQPYNYSKIN